MVDKMDENKKKKIDLNEKQFESVLTKILLDYSRLNKEEKERKKKKSESNKRYYQKNRDDILRKNREMRQLYKAVKQN